MEKKPKKITIAVVTPTLSKGGAEGVLRRLIHALDRSKFEVVVILISETTPLHITLKAPNTRYIYLNCHRAAFATFRIHRALTDIKPNIILSTHVHINMMMLAMKLLTGLTAAVIVRESSIPTFSIASHKFPRLWKFGYRFLYNRADKIIAQSKFMSDDLISNFFVSAEKCEIIYNPVDLASVRKYSTEAFIYPFTAIPSNAIKLIWVGRISEVKNLPLLLSAIQLLPNAYLTVVGEGQLESRSKQICLELGISERVAFIGHQSNPYPYIKNSHALILTSKYEGFPNVALEALACGVPVVSPRIPGGLIDLAEISRSCHLCEAYEPAILAQAIQTAVCKDNIKHDPHDSLSDFNIDAIIRDYQSLFLDYAKF